MDLLKWFGSRALLQHAQTTRGWSLEEGQTLLRVVHQDQLLLPNNSAGAANAPWEIIWIKASFF